jgi:hypothetical protein
MTYYTKIIEKIRNFFRPKPQYNCFKKNLEEQRELLKKVNYDAEKDPNQLKILERMKLKGGWVKYRLCA